MIDRAALSSYRVFRPIATPLARALGGLGRNLWRSGLPLTPEAYVSFILLVMLVLFGAGGLGVFGAAFRTTGQLAYASVMGVGGGLVAAMLGMAVLYTYPSLVAYRKRREIEEHLPYVLTLISILLSAGVSLRRIFRLLALMEERGRLYFGGEAKNLYRNMEYLGYDVISALKELADRRVSPLLTTSLEGFIATIRTGGDLATFLQEEARGLMRLRRSIIKEFLDNLVMISEIYMAVMVAFPLMLIIMLVIMASISGGVGLFGMSIQDLLTLLIYGMVPMSGVTMIVYLKAISPG